MHICRRRHRVLVQGITGKQGTFWTERMQEYGAKVIGVTGGRDSELARQRRPVPSTAVCRSMPRRSMRPKRAMSMPP